jgi:hypothetical protein
VAARNPGALFGLITFYPKIGLYDMQGPIPVLNVNSPPDMDGKLAIDLDVALPLPAFPAPICSAFCLLPTLLVLSFHCDCLLYPFLSCEGEGFLGILR